ncbi:MAG: ribosome silencing factor [Bacteroidetes bacterium]|nr:MAG: ribosome silencing factor [Bacteroidota bacterium]
MVPRRTKDKTRQTHIPVKELARSAVDAILSKKGRDILVLDVNAVSGIADFFILATGDSNLQIKAIVEAVRLELQGEHGERPWHVEGSQHSQWVLLDYVDLVVHIFNEEKRSFYSLERLWGDAPKEAVPDDGSGESVNLLDQSIKIK